MRPRRVVACVLLFGGCIEAQPPGDLVGAYDVTGELLENSCGEQALPSADPMTFRVELREDAEVVGVGYWLVTPPARAGRLSASGAFAFEAESRYVLRETRAPEVEFTADPERAIDPEQIDDQRQLPGECTLTVAESIEGQVWRDHGAAVLDAASEDFSGTNEIAVRTDAAPACQALLTAAGGPWAELPCRVRYTLSGDRTAAP